MTPIEAMARAAWEAQHGKRIWETRVGDDHKREFCGYMRAALLALAEVELSEEAIEAGADAYHQANEEFRASRAAAYAKTGRPVPDGAPDHSFPMHHLPPSFKAILRSLAEQS